MTVILGVDSPDGAWFGCDSLFATDRVYDGMRAPKWTTHRTHAVATSGAMRPGQIAETLAVTEKRRRGETPIAYVLRAIASPMREAVMADLYENEKPAEMRALVAYEGSVYEITDDWGVYQSRFGYHAIGMGSSHALAAYDALSVVAPEMAVPDRIRLALEATERHCTYVRGPFTVARVSER
jgi:hypothetical protein